MIDNATWQKIEHELRGQNPHVQLQAHQFKLTIERVERKEGYYPLCVFIDGKIKQDWFDRQGLTTQAPEIAHLVYCERKTAAYSTKDQKAIIKAYGKRQALQIYPNLHSHIVYYTPYHNSAKQLTKQLIKNLSSLATLKVLSIGLPKLSSDAARELFNRVVNDMDDK